MMETRTTFVKGWIIAWAAALALAAFAMAFAFIPPAHANTQLGAPTTVSDDITRVHVNKLDADTHEHVVGATMVIIDEETGEVIDEWITDGSMHQYEKGSLVVERVYILRELAAPDGYERVDDVRFVVNEMEGKGLTVISGTSGQFDQTSANVIALYDTAVPVEKETVVTETRPASSSPTRAAAPKTGDETPMTTVALFVSACVIAIFALQLLKRRVSKKQ